MVGRRSRLSRRLVQVLTPILVMGLAYAMLPCVLKLLAATALYRLFILPAPFAKEKP